MDVNVAAAAVVVAAGVADTSGVARLLVLSAAIGVIVTVSIL